MLEQKTDQMGIAHTFRHLLTIQIPFPGFYCTWKNWGEGAKVAVAGGDARDGRHSWNAW